VNLLEAQTLFRDYIDDPDQTFLTDTQVNQYLKFGIDDWRAIVRQHRPDMLLETVELTVANAANYTAQPASAKPINASLDLNDAALLYPGKAANTPLMGPNVVAGPPVVTYYGPIQTITNIYMGASKMSRDRTVRMVPVASGAPLNLSSSLANYMLQRYIIYFNARFPDEFTIEYFPIRATNPETMAADANIENGMLENFHELLVLLATRRYFIRDGVLNEPIERQIALLSDTFVRFLLGGRLRDAFNSVSVTHLY
tara:strand:- start:2734 stop:3501 length:768 start_codon:yes stop_codon:yes gene_type:complete